MKDRIIKTNNVKPPIPIRDFDWVAWFDDIGEEWPVGIGPTREDAIASLLEVEVCRHKGNTDDGGNCHDCQNTGYIGAPNWTRGLE